MGKFEIKGEERRFAALLISLTGLQIAVYYLAAAWVNGAGPLAIPQPDTLLYCQAARRICEGHAFSFSAGTAVSTGTTSVLYPFVLAIPYWLGFKGDSLISAGFVLNSLFYLAFILGWASAFKQWLPKAASRFAAILLVAFHQPAFCALAQSDTGLWMAVSGLLVAAWASGRWKWAFLLCVLGPWVRPEGAILAFAMAIISFLCKDWRGVLLGASGLASALGVFGFNNYLTGLGGFASVANKGYFSQYPFAVAVLKCAAQFFVMVRELVFSTATGLPRGFYSVPVVGGLAVVLGAYVWDYSRSNWRQLAALVFAALISLMVVAQSGYQGTNNDRYLAWVMPVAIVLAANGFFWAWERFGRVARARSFLVVPVLYFVLTGVSSVFYYHLACDDMEQVVRFAKEIDRTTLNSESVGTGGWSGIAYFLGDRRVANTGGIYSPEFAATGIPGMLEILKNEPAVRFKYWLLVPDDGIPPAVRKTQGETVLPGPSSFELKRTKWQAFDRGARAPVVSNKVLRCQVDVGYEKDMRRSGYEIVSCYGMAPFKPLLTVAELDGEKAVDTGLMVLGYDEMTVEGLQPGKDVVIALRTVDAAVARSEDPFGAVQQADYDFMGEIGLHLSVDGRDVACCHAHIRHKGFNEVFLTVPAKFVQSSTHRIGIHGDHAAYGYWFYQ